MAVESEAEPEPVGLEGDEQPTAALNKSKLLLDAIVERKGFARANIAIEVERLNIKP